MCMGEKPKFTAVYDWLLRLEELSSTEKLIIAHVLRYGKRGCYKSNSRLAADLGIARTNLIKVLHKLQRKEWIAIEYPSKRERFMFVYEEALKDMPLFDSVKGCGKPSSFAVKSSESGAEGGDDSSPSAGDDSLQVGDESSPPLNRTSKDLSYSNSRETKEVNFAAAAMKEEGSRLSPEAADRRRRHLLDQFEAMRADEKDTE